MQNREVFKWTFTASGLWLLVSPFILLGGQSALSDAVVGDAGVLMIAGLLALAIAGYSGSGYSLVRAFAGMVLGLVLVAAPSAFEFNEIIATWNAKIVGTILVLVALYEANQHKSKRKSW